MLIMMIGYILSVLFIIYGLCILLTLGFSYWFNYFPLLFGIFILLFIKLLKDGKNRQLVRVLSFVVSIFLISFIIIESCIIKFSFSIPKDDCTYLIVLGSKVNDDGPSIDFKSRLDIALDYLLKNSNTIAIVTGAKGNDEPISEAQCAKEYLMKNGIAENRIIMEDKSFSTYENLSNAKVIILELCNSLDQSVVVVSTNFHLFRANYIAEKIGFTDLSYKGSRGWFYIEPHYFVREYFAYIKELIFNN